MVKKFKPRSEKKSKSLAEMSNRPTQFFPHYTSSSQANIINSLAVSVE